MKNIFLSITILLSVIIVDIISANSFNNLNNSKPRHPQRRMKNRYQHDNFSRIKKQSFTNNSLKKDYLIETTDTIFVDKTANGNNDGTSWNDAYNYLQDALKNVKSNCQIWISEGIYYPDESANQSIDNKKDTSFVISQGIQIYGGFAGFESNIGDRILTENKTILSGNIDQANNSSENS